MMRYCDSCGSEYQDSVTKCSDCGEVEMLTAEQMKARGKLLPGERDTRRFVRAGTAEDPLSAEQIAKSLEEAGISVFARARRASSVDALTEGSTLPWWEILVPEDMAERATVIIKEQQRSLEANAKDAAQAAADEELAGEEALKKT